MITTSIIIPTYHRFETLKQMLRSLKKELKQDAEVVIVEQHLRKEKIDKGQRAYDIKKILGRYHFTYLLIHEIGMTHANNLGIKKARGKYVLFFDDDVSVHKNCVQQLLIRLKNRSVGVVGGRVITVDQQEEPTRKDTGRISLLGSFSNGFSSKIPQEVDTVVGCNWAIRKDLLQTLGGFDEQITGFGMREESDVCLRVKENGLKIMFDPRSVVTHKRIETGGGRKSEGRLNWYYHYFSNETYFFLKHRPKILLPIFLVNRINFALRCMFGFGREVSVQSMTTPIRGVIYGFLKFKKLKIY